MTARWETHPKTQDALKRLVRHDVVPWGCLKDLTTVDQVLERLAQCPPVLIKDLSSPMIHVYHTADLGVGCVTRIDTSVLENAMLMGQIDPETPITLRYRLGNLFCLIKPEELPAMVSLSQDVYFLVSTETNALITTHIGKYHWHHAMYQYYHLDKKVTTLKKLLDTKRFTSVCIDLGGDDHLLDIPY